MGETNLNVELTTFDKVSVTLYRTGIILATLCLLFGVYYFHHLIGALITGSEPLPIGSYGEEMSKINRDLIPEILRGDLPTVVFWVFFCSVGVSISFLHLYSKQILQVIRSFFVLGALILIPLNFLGADPLLKMIILRDGGYGLLGTFGMGFLLAAFGGVGAKEAFCFKLYEGYLYAILSAILVLMHLVGLFSAKAEWVLLCIITVVVVIFTIKKMRLPLHYDIGDKSRY